MLPVVIAFCALIAFAGCTGTQTSGTAPGQVPASSGASAGAGTGSGAVSLVPQPTDTIPSYNSVTIAVQDKDYLGNVQVGFDGGLGQVHVTKITATIYRADGLTKTYTIGSNKGDEASLEGTKQTDRVTVDVTMDNGQTYRVADQLSPYRTRG